MQAAGKWNPSGQQAEAAPGFPVSSPRNSTVKSQAGGAPWALPSPLLGPTQLEYSRGCDSTTHACLGMDFRPEPGHEHWFWAGNPSSRDSIPGKACKDPSRLPATHSFLVVTGDPAQNGSITFCDPALLASSPSHPQPFSQSPNKILAEGFPGGYSVESLPCNAGEAGSVPGRGGSHMPQGN